MALDKETKLEIETMITDGLAGAGEGFATQARTAASEAITEGTAKITTDLKALTDKVAAIPAQGEIKDLDRIVSERVKAGLAEFATASAKAATDADAARKIEAARAAFLAENGKKLPKTYHGLIPVTDDPAKLQAALTAATAQLTEDLKAVGATLPSVGASASGAGAGNADQAAADAGKGKNPVAALAEALASQQK